MSVCVCGSRNGSLALPMHCPMVDRQQQQCVYLICQAKMPPAFYLCPLAIFPIISVRERTWREREREHTHTHTHTCCVCYRGCQQQQRKQQQLQLRAAPSILDCQKYIGQTTTPAPALVVSADDGIVKSSAISHAASITKISVGFFTTRRRLSRLLFQQIFCYTKLHRSRK